MTIGQSGVGGPHNVVQFQEPGEERRAAVVDLFVVFANWVEVNQTHVS